MVWYSKPARLNGSAARGQVEPNAAVVIECLSFPGVKAVYCEKPMAVRLASHGW